MAFHRKFLTYDVQILFLFKSVDVIGNEVLVQKHTVLKVLETSNVVKCKAVCLVLYVYTSVEHIATVGTMFVCRYFIQELGVGFFALCLPGVKVRVSSLV